MSIEEQLEPIRTFEKQSGLSRLLIFLHIQGSCNISYMVDVTNIHPTAAYRAVKKATELKLISSDYTEENNFRVRRLQLTEKGRKIAKLLSEVNDLLTK